MKRATILTTLLLTVLNLLSAQSATPYIYNKVSPHLSRLVHNAPATSRGAAGQQAAQTVMVLTKLVPGADADELSARYGLHVEATIGRVLVVSMPIDQVESMAADDRVVRIEAERAPRKLLDKMPAQIGADKLHNGTSHQLTQAYDGSGTVVGIVDAGLDYVNPFFRDSEGKSRIKWVTDYAATPTRRLTTPDEIWSAQHSSDAATEWHGTHVAGIAAGSLVHSTSDVAYQGIAPGADIAEACINLAGVNPILNPGDPTSAPALLAINDIFAYAESQGKPCVVNFSAGITQTFANNRQLEEEALQTLASKPGRAIVVAAGNQGLYRYLAHKPASQPKAGAGVRFHREDGYGAYFGAEFKISHGQTITVTYYNEQYTQSHGQLTVTAADLKGATGGSKDLQIGSGIYLRRLTATLVEEQTDGYDIVSIATTNPNTTFPETDRMLLTIEGEGEAWIYADNACAPLEDVAAISGHQTTVDGYTVGWPGSVESVITVGNIGWRFKASGSWGNSIDWGPIEMGKGEGYLANSSACGPTLDGRHKPDVCAPGVNIISAYNNFVNETYEQYLMDETMGMLDTDYEPENGGFFALLSQTGTSMSAPAVAGTIALWMQADPTLTNDRIKDVLAHSSRQPDAELSYPNDQYGHGEIDAYSGLLYLLDPTTSILPVSRHQPVKAAIRLQGRRLSFQLVNSDESCFGVSIYSTDGRRVAQYTLRGPEAHADLSNLPAGVYAVQLNTGRPETTGSTLIRL